MNGSKKAFLFLATAFSLAAEPTLILSPSALEGNIGATVGWGFTITNDSGYIEITSSQFCLSPVNFVTNGCTLPLTGSYNDIISSAEDIVVGPPGGTLPDSVTQSFDPVAMMTGVGSFTINPGTPFTNSDVGEIVLTYNLSDMDPNSSTYDAGVDLVATDQVLFANTSVTTTIAPEPSTAALLMAAAVVLRLGNRCRIRV